MRFRYKAQKPDGSFYESAREATDKYALARELRVVGETLVSANEEGKGPTLNLDLGRLLGIFRRIRIHDKIVFARNLGGMLGAGLSLSRALAVLERQTHNTKFKNIIRTLLERIGGGESLSQALGAFPVVFPPLFAAMVKAGEEGGNLAGALGGIAEQLDRSFMLQRKIQGALMYPAIVLTVMVIIGVIMFVYIVPRLTVTFTEFNVALPLSTRIVIGVSELLKNHLLSGISVLLALFLALRFAARSRRGRRAIDYMLLHIPAISVLVREANAARVGGTLSSLLFAGVPVVQALEITADVVPNGFYKEVLVLARGAVQKGEPMSAVFQRSEPLYPAVLSEMVAVGEETGKLSGMLKEIALFFEAEVDQKTKNLSTILEPALMVIVGVAVGFFAVAMISPAYSLMNSI